MGGSQGEGFCDSHFNNQPPAELPILPTRLGTVCPQPTSDHPVRHPGLGLP